MKRIKNLWHQNRILFTLFTIVLICVIIIVSVVITAFLGSSKSVYGDRLEGIEQVELKEEVQNSFKDKMISDEQISDCIIKSKGKIIYITLIFKETISLVEAQSKALASLDLFEKKYLEFYDVHYTLKQNATENNEGFLIMGSKNVSGSGLIWNNNTEVPKEE